MTENNASEKDSLLSAYRQSGKVTALTGIKPIEAIQEIIKNDPEKQNAFLDGAAEGQRIRQEEEEKASK